MEKDNFWKSKSEISFFFVQLSRNFTQSFFFFGNNLNAKSVIWIIFTFLFRKNILHYTVVDLKKSRQNQSYIDTFTLEVFTRRKCGEKYGYFVVTISLLYCLNFRSILQIVMRFCIIIQSSMLFKKANSLSRKIS